MFRTFVCEIACKINSQVSKNIQLSGDFASQPPPATLPRTLLGVLPQTYLILYRQFLDLPLAEARMHCGLNFVWGLWFSIEKGLNLEVMRIVTLVGPLRQI